MAHSNPEHIAGGEWLAVTSQLLSISPAVLGMRCSWEDETWGCMVPLAPKWIKILEVAGLVKCFGRLEQGKRQVLIAIYQLESSRGGSGAPMTMFKETAP